VNQLVTTGGRAAGDGRTTVDQQFYFNSTAILSGRIGFPLVRDAVNNGVGPGNQCLTFNFDGFLSNLPCSPPNFTPQQTWLVGDTASVPPAVTPATTFPTSTPSASSTSASEVFTLSPPGRDGPGKPALLYSFSNSQLKRNRAHI